MVDKLQLGSAKCKCDRLSRSDRRLVGWIKYRLSRSSKPWIHLCLRTFCKATGISLITAKRSLKKIRSSAETEIIARTINENRTWKVLVSSTQRLHGIKRSEPFSIALDGQQRIVKDHIRGKRINEEQLVLNEEPLMWKAKPDNQIEQDTPNSKFGETENPNQMTFDDGLSSGSLRSPGKTAHTRSSCTTNKHVWTKFREYHFSDRHYKGGFSEEKQRSKHGTADVGVKTRNLAWFIARNDLRNEHWSNCKVEHTMRHGFTYALQELRRGCNRQTIVKAYSMALHEIHAVAVDSGVTKEGSWKPSSTIARARKILVDGECHGKYWARITNKRQKVVVTADAQTGS